jgi:prolipoprotein diacylglyceryltransferase
MLPYFHAPPLTHYACLASAVLLGHALQRIRARQLGLDHVQAGTLSLVLVIGAAYGAHWLALAAKGQLFTSRLGLILFPYAGGMSLGGLGGGLLAAMGYAHWKRLPLRQHLDAAAWAFPPAWAVLRTGCFLAHDSLGKFSDGPLAVNTPTSPRHDLALYEILWALTLTGIFARWPANPAPKLLISYGLLRAAIAPLRLEPSSLDYAGAAVLISAGAVILRQSRTQRG